MRGPELSSIDEFRKKKIASTDPVTGNFDPFAVADEFSRTVFAKHKKTGGTESAGGGLSENQSSHAGKNRKQSRQRGEEQDFRVDDSSPVEQEPEPEQPEPLSPEEESRMKELEKANADQNTPPQQRLEYYTLLYRHQVTQPTVNFRHIERTQGQIERYTKAVEALGEPQSQPPSGQQEDRRVAEETLFQALTVNSDPKSDHFNDETISVLAQAAGVENPDEWYRTRLEAMTSPEPTEPATAEPVHDIEPPKKDITRTRQTREPLQPIDVTDEQSGDTIRFTGKRSRGEDVYSESSDRPDVAGADSSDAAKEDVQQMLDSRRQPVLASPDIDPETNQGTVVKGVRIPEVRIMEGEQVDFPDDLNRPVPAYPGDDASQLKGLEKRLFIASQQVNDLRQELSSMDPKTDEYHEKQVFLAKALTDYEQTERNIFMPRMVRESGRMREIPPQIPDYLRPGYSQNVPDAQGITINTGGSAPSENQPSQQAPSGAESATGVQASVVAQDEQHAEPASGPKPREYAPMDQASLDEFKRAERIRALEQSIPMLTGRQQKAARGALRDLQYEHGNFVNSVIRADKEGRPLTRVQADALEQFRRESAKAEAKSSEVFGTEPEKENASSPEVQEETLNVNLTEFQEEDREIRKQQLEAEALQARINALDTAQKKGRTVKGETKSIGELQAEFDKKVGELQVLEDVHNGNLEKIYERGTQIQKDLASGQKPTTALTAEEQELSKKHRESAARQIAVIRGEVVEGTDQLQRRVHDDADMSDGALSNRKLRLEAERAPIERAIEEANANLVQITADIESLRSTLDPGDQTAAERLEQLEYERNIIEGRIVENRFRLADKNILINPKDDTYDHMGESSKSWNKPQQDAGNYKPLPPKLVQELNLSIDPTEDNLPELRSKMRPDLQKGWETAARNLKAGQIPTGHQSLPEQGTGGKNRGGGGGGYGYQDTNSHAGFEQQYWGSQRDDVIQRIKAIDGISDTERADLIEQAKSVPYNQTMTFSRSFDGRGNPRYFLKSYSRLPLKEAAKHGISEAISNEGSFWMNRAVEPGFLWEEYQEQLNVIQHALPPDAHDKAFRALNSKLAKGAITLAGAAVEMGDIVIRYVKEPFAESEPNRFWAGATPDNTLRNVGALGIRAWGKAFREQLKKKYPDTRFPEIPVIPNPPLHKEVFFGTGKSGYSGGRNATFSERRYDNFDKYGRERDVFERYGYSRPDKYKGGKRDH